MLTVTTLSPVVGYFVVARIAKAAVDEDVSVHEAARRDRVDPQVLAEVAFKK